VDGFIAALLSIFKKEDKILYIKRLPGEGAESYPSPWGEGRVRDVDVSQIPGGKSYNPHPALPRPPGEGAEFDLLFML
jgi:hypothetical protein